MGKTLHKHKVSEKLVLQVTIFQTKNKGIILGANTIPASNKGAMAKTLSLIIFA